MVLYFQMEVEGIESDWFTLTRVLKACARLGSIQVGEAVLNLVMMSLCSMHLLIFMQNVVTLLRLESFCYQIDNKDLISWTSMLIGRIRHGLFTAEMIDEAYAMIVEKNGG